MMGEMTLEAQQQDIVQHLQFLGYEVQQEENALFARHARRFNVSIRLGQSGALFRAVFGGSEAAKANRDELLEVVNKANRAALASRFYTDDESDLWVEAFYPGSYDRTVFGRFLDLWESGFDALHDIPDFKKFLT